MARACHGQARARRSSKASRSRPLTGPGRQARSVSGSAWFAAVQEHRASFKSWSASRLDPSAHIDWLSVAPDQRTGAASRGLALAYRSGCDKRWGRLEFAAISNKESSLMRIAATSVGGARLVLAVGFWLLASLAESNAQFFNISPLPRPPQGVPGQ